MTAARPPECSSVVDIDREPRPLDPAVVTLPSGTVLWHVGFAHLPFAGYDTRADTDYRFSPLSRPREEVGTLYAGEAKEVAIAETLWRQLPLRGATLPLERVQARTIGSVKALRDLRLAQLHDPGLRRLGLRAENLTQTPAACYRWTRAYGQALLDDRPDIDGIVWMSGRFNTLRAVILIATGDPQFVPQGHTSFADSSERDDLIRLCESAGISVTLPAADI